MTLLLDRLIVKGISLAGSSISRLVASVQKNIEYADAVKQIDALIAPYKSDLMKTQYGSRLFNPDDLIKEVTGGRGSSIRSRLKRDLISVMSTKDYTSFCNILEPFLKK